MNAEHLSIRNIWREKISNLIAGKALPETTVLRIDVLPEHVEAPAQTEEELM